MPSERQCCLHVQLILELCLPMNSTRLGTILDLSLFISKVSCSCYNRPHIMLSFRELQPLLSNGRLSMEHASNLPPIEVFKQWARLLTKDCSVDLQQPR